MKTIKNHYYKDDGTHTAFMSGLPLPHDEDGITRRIAFVDCEFHPACWKEYRKSGGFENCTFEGCNVGEEKLV